MKYPKSWGGGLLHLLLLLAWLVVLALLFSMVEIQIEGARGWAAGLPTWRVVDAPFLRLFFGGREITGYHVFVFGFMVSVFHLPLFMARHWSLRLEARILGSLMLFWILEDAFWFALNPAYGWAGLTPERASWHPHWILGVPADYIFFPIPAALLLVWSFSPISEILPSPTTQNPELRT